MSSFCFRNLLALVCCFLYLKLMKICGFELFRDSTFVPAQNIETAPVRKCSQLFSEVEDDF